MVELDEHNHTSNGDYAKDNRVTALDEGRDINETTDDEVIDVESKLLENGIKPKIKEDLNVEPNKGSKTNNNNKKKGEKSDYDRLMTEDINKLLADMPLTEDTTCGFWILRGKFFQRFANQTAYVVLYGLVGSVFSMTYAYFNGTITTIEKRFKIPSKNTGIISVGNDISQMLVSAVLSYYAGKGHRPRWIGFGLITIVTFCLLTASPHFLYGPGEDALALTEEFGAVLDANATKEIVEQQKAKSLCRLNGGGAKCEGGEGNLAPQIVLFIAQFISGIGGSLYYTLGVSYMDDNTKKSKTPALLSLSYFLRMLGPAVGYALASFCLRVYIAPQLKPVITNADPRWIGAWWMGWLVLGGLLLFSGIFLTMFPKQLPRAVARRTVEEERKKQRAAAAKEASQDKSAKETLNMALENGIDQQQSLTSTEVNETAETKASFKDMLTTFKRLISNKTLMYNNLSSVFYLFGYTPYWIFTPKYIEIQYRQSAATSSMVTGTVALAFSAVGVLLSGFVISRYKPRARSMAAWNVLVGFLTVFGILAYAFVGCPGNEKSVIVNIHDSALSNATTCNSACNCDYVRYSPVCGENSMTYISPCHAGCKKQHMDANGKKIFYECACIPNNNNSSSISKSAIFKKLTAMDLKIENELNDSKNQRSITDAIATSSITNLALATNENVFPPGGQAISGACPVDCFAQFVTFLAVMCCLKFVGATGRATNFLVTVRCVPEKDKTAAMGFGMMMMSMLAFIPSPIFFGWILDRLCLVWGKTCTNKGNCWLYDPESLRYTLNFTAAALITIGTFFDGAVWYYVKDLKIFDEEVKDMEMKIVQHEEEIKPDKNAEL